MKKLTKLQKNHWQSQQVKDLFLIKKNKYKNNEKNLIDAQKEIKNALEDIYTFLYVYYTKGNKDLRIRENNFLHFYSPLFSDMERYCMKTMPLKFKKFRYWWGAFCDKIVLVILAIECFVDLQKILSEVVDEFFEKNMFLSKKHVNKIIPMIYNEIPGTTDFLNINYKEYAPYFNLPCWRMKMGKYQQPPYKLILNLINNRFLNFKEM